MNCNRKQEIEKKISLLEKELALIKKQELEEKIGKNYKLNNHTYFKVKKYIKRGQSGCRSNRICSTRCFLCSHRE